MTLQTTDTIARFEEAFAQAGQLQPISEHTVRIAGVIVRLRYAGPTVARAVLPALAHLPAADPTGPIVTLNVWDTASTQVTAPRHSFAPADYHRYGQRAVAFHGALSLMHAPAERSFYAYDCDARRGFCWTEDAKGWSIYERAAPLQTLFHWAMREYGWRIVHAAAVGTESGGVLLVGNSGAGKSTTALSCLTQPGLRLLSDDKCLVRLDPAPQAFAAFSSGKITGDMLTHLPQFQARLNGWDNGAKGGKGLVFLYPDYAEGLIASFAIKALVIPQVADQKHASIQPLSRASAFQVFGPSTVIWLPGSESEIFRFTAELVRRLPCYRLNLALTPQFNIDAIQDLLRRL